LDAFQATRNHNKDTSWMHFRQQGTITKTVKKKCGSRDPKIESSATNLKELI